MKHLLGQPQKPVAGVVEQGVSGSFVAGKSLVDQQLQLGIGRLDGRHDDSPWKAVFTKNTAHITRKSRHGRNVTYEAVR